MKNWRQTLFFTLLGAVLALIALAVGLLLTAQPHGEAITLQPAPSPAPILVDVAGAVNGPGVYSLPAGSRVQDAIQAAGGLTEKANRSAINLAAKLKDGEKVLVQEIGSTPIAPPASTPGARSHTIPTQEYTGPVNLNTATLEQLQTLPGIGPTKAEQIIVYREAKGGFKSIEEIQNVSGIGPATFEKIKSRLTVE